MLKIKKRTSESGLPITKNGPHEKYMSTCTQWIGGKRYQNGDILTLPRASGAVVTGLRVGRLKLK